MCAYFTEVGYLERVPWTDGTEAFCKRCDSRQPMAYNGRNLQCPAGHTTHPAQLIASGELAR